MVIFMGTFRFLWVLLSTFHDFKFFSIGMIHFCLQISLKVELIGDSSIDDR